MTFFYQFIIGILLNVYYLLFIIGMYLFFNVYYFLQNGSNRKDQRRLFTNLHMISWGLFATTLFQYYFIFIESDVFLNIAN